MTVTAYCEAHLCHHNQRIDLEALKAKIGPDAPAMADDIVPRLKCAKCGSKKVGLIYAPDPERHTGMGQSHRR